MTAPKRVALQRVQLKGHPLLTERWIQDQLASEPALLGLGDVVLKDKERPQPYAGRLDLLLQETEGTQRYEVEVQLGRTDESHIIRTIEYWDIERKRSPQYDHCAVIVAEEITARFLNVISLFNGHLPIIALQMSCYELGDGFGLAFTRVLDEVSLGLVDDDEEVQEITDRSYWEAKGSKSSLQLVDDALRLIQSFAPGYELKYNKYYIGLGNQGLPDNFVIFRVKKNHMHVEVRLAKSKEFDEQIEAAGFDVLGYDNRWHRYRLRVTKEDLKRLEPDLTKLMRQAFDAK